MASTFKIESGIPVPPGNRANYPFAKMKVGDSFLVPGVKNSAAIASSVSYRKNRYGENYVCRTTEGGLRVWRIA
jgi:hypothetical protein